MFQTLRHRHEHDSTVIQTIEHILNICGMEQANKHKTLQRGGFGEWLARTHCPDVYPHSRRSQPTPNHCLARLNWIFGPTPECSGVTLCSRVAPKRYGKNRHILFTSFGYYRNLMTRRTESYMDEWTDWNKLITWISAGLIKCCNHKWSIARCRWTF